MNPFSYITNFFSGLTTKVRLFFSSPGGRVVKNAIARFIETVGPVAASVLMEIAAKAVAAQATKPGGSGAKYAGAFYEIKGALLQAGLDAADKDINFAIEAAVQALRK